MVLTKVKTTIGQCQGTILGDWMAKDKQDTHQHHGEGVATMQLQVGLADLALKMGEDLTAACGVTRELLSRQSDLMKGSWPSNVWNLIWTISPSWLSD